MNLLTKEDLQDLVNATLVDLNVVQKFTTKGIYTRFNNSKCLVLAWIGDKQNPAYFDINTLSSLESDAYGFFNYIKSQLRKAGVEC